MSVISLRNLSHPVELHARFYINKPIFTGRSSSRFLLLMHVTRILIPPARLHRPNSHPNRVLGCSPLSERMVTDKRRSTGGTIDENEATELDCVLGGTTPVAHAAKVRRRGKRVHSHPAQHTLFSLSSFFTPSDLLLQIHIPCVFCVASIAEGFVDSMQKGSEAHLMQWLMKYKALSVYTT